MARVIIVAARPPARATATPDQRAGSHSDHHADDHGPERPELDITESERHVGQAGRLRRRRDRGQRGAVGGELDEGQMAEGQDSRLADEDLQAEDDDEVDEQLLDEQLAGSTARRRVDERPDHEHHEQRHAGADAAGEPAGEGIHYTRSAVRTVKRPCGRTMNRSAMSTNTKASVSRSNTPSGR